MKKQAGALIGAVLPHTEDIFQIVYKCIVCQHIAVLVQRIHIKHEHTAGVHKERDPGKGALYLPQRGQVIDAVQTAEDRIHRAVQVDGLHFLAKV